MKSSKLLLIITAMIASVSLVSGADLVSYTASDDPNNSPDANGNTVDVWTLTHAGSGTAPANYGSFLGDSGQNAGGSGAGAGTSAWGLYANHTSPADFTNEVAIGHNFSGGALSLGQSVSIDFDGGFADTGGEYGIRLFGPDGFTLALVFAGGDTYRYYDGTTSFNLAGPGYSPDGFNFQYTQVTSTTYSVVLTDGTGIIGSFSGTVAGAPDFIQVYNKAAGAGAGYDVYTNNLQIVPEPNSLAYTICGGLLLLLVFRMRRSARA